MNVLDVCGFKVVHIFLPTQIASVRAVANATGSVYESSPSHQGAAHFLEHMFFKGTKNRSYSEIGLLLDELGDHNATTSHHDTRFYINCRTPRWGKAFGLLCELLFENVIDEEEFQKERSVILEELGMRDDDPTDFFMDRLRTDTYKISCVGGSIETVANMTPAHLTDHRKLYDRSNIFFVIAGNIPQEAVAQECSGILEAYKISEGTRRERSTFVFNPDELHLEHPTGQGIFAVAMEGFDEEESFRNNLVDMVFAHGFGGASSSVLYERIRQELGLCYAIGHSPVEVSNRDLCLSWGITSPKNLHQAVDEVTSLLAKVRQDGFGDRLRIYKENLYHHIAGIAEKAASSAAFFGDTWMKNKYHHTAESLIGMFEKVENRDIAEYAKVLGSRGTKLILMGV